jgi:hypothetical protein
MTRFRSSAMMFGEIASPTKMASPDPTYKIGAVCQETFVKKKRIVLGPCLASTLETKLIFSRSNKPEVKDSHENMGHCRRRADSPVLSELFGAASQYG